MGRRRGPSLGDDAWGLGAPRGEQRGEAQRPTPVPSDAELVHVEPEPLRDAPLVLLSPEAKAFARSSLSRKTRDVYEWHWGNFTRWCRERGREVLPTEPGTLADYIAHRAIRGTSGEIPLQSKTGRAYTTSGEAWAPATISQGLAAIAKAHELAGYLSPRGHTVVKTVWKGIAHEKGLAPRRQASPLLVPDLLERLPGIFPDTLRGLRGRALLLLGFGAALRRGELVALEVRDLVFGDRGLTVTVRRHVVGSGGETAAGSKADQEGRGQVVAVARARGALCPVVSVQAWLERAQIVTGLVFRQVVGGEGRETASEKGLSPAAVALLVKQAARKLGLDPSSYSGHSLRAGLATSAAKRGRPLWAIQRQTRHRRLDTLALYIRSALAFEDNVTDGLM